MKEAIIIYWQRWLDWSGKSTNRRIFRAAVILGSITFLVGIISVAKELVTAYCFGVGDAVDAFLIAFLLPTFIIAILASSFSSAFIPIYIRVREKKGPAAAKELFSSVVAWSLLLLLALTIALALSIKYILPFLASNFTPQKLALTRRLFFMLLPVLVLSGVSSLWISILNAEERFAAGAFAPAVNYLTSISFLLLFAKKLGIFSLAIGTIAGFILQCSVLARELKRNNINLLPKWQHITLDTRDVFKQYLPMIAGALAMGITTLVNQAMAAMFAPGSVAALNYASKPTLFIIFIGSVAIGTAVLPHFSRMVVKQDWQGIKRTLKAYVRLILLVTVPLTVIAILFSKNIVALLFQRGAFTPGDTQFISQIQALYALQIPFYILGILGIRLMSASLMNNYIFIIAVTSLIINVLLNLVFSKYFGIAGIALSTSMVYFFSCSAVFLTFWASKKKKIHNDMVFGESLDKSASP